MIQIKGRTFLLGGFHDHWERADSDNPTLLLAALDYYHYDFVTLMDGALVVDKIQKAAAAFGSPLKAYYGREEEAGWAHIVTLNPHAPALVGDSVDYRRDLRLLKSTCDLVILAHPNYIAWESLVLTGEIDRLLDEGLLDGVQIPPAGEGPFAERDRALAQWYRDRLASGKITGTVGGWDLHHALPLRNLPPVLYSAERSPDGHFEAPCDNRTIIEAEANTLPAICAAVRAGRTVVENLRTGDMLGPPDLIAFLTTNGYTEAVARLDKTRDGVTFSLGGPWIGGRPVEMHVSRSGTLRLPTSLTEAVDAPALAGVPVRIPAVPLPVAQDRYYLPVAWRGSDADTRLWAVEAAHPIQYDVLPLLVGGVPHVEFLPTADFHGEVSMEVEGVLPETRVRCDGATLIPLGPKAVGTTPFSYRCKATAAGVSRQQEGSLTYIGVPRYNGDWSAIPCVGVDEPRYAPKSAYGAKRPWPGPDAYSAQLRFAWTDTAFMFQADVVDAVHFQPFEGHYAYNADCLQLALDPMLRRRHLLGNVYSFNLTLGPKGSELYRWKAPQEEESAGFHPPADDVSLGARYLQVAKTERGLQYELRLPWAELAPFAPMPGERMGIYLIMMNSNGGGLIDTLHWPVPISGMWTIPRKWGVLTLLDDC